MDGDGGPTLLQGAIEELRDPGKRLRRQPDGDGRVEAMLADCVQCAQNAIEGAWRGAVEGVVKIGVESVEADLERLCESLAAEAVEESVSQEAAVGGDASGDAEFAHEGKDVDHVFTAEGLTS